MRTKLLQRGAALVLGLLPATAWATARDAMPLVGRDRTDTTLDDAIWNHVPDITVSVDRRPVEIIQVLFDGTRNDRLAVPKGERQTVIGELNDVLERNGHPLRYYPGAGTQHNRLRRWSDAAWGWSVRTTAESACSFLQERTRAVLADKPDADIRVFVAGFSRGAASARHFMNLADHGCAGVPSLHLYALLYDTVATGSAATLDLSVPASADWVAHFVSLDERRVFFKPTIDVSERWHARGENLLRINTLYVAGVHSDVGASYSDGVGNRYLAHTRWLLARLGLSDERQITEAGDRGLDGKHDSRWPLEHILLIPAADTELSAARVLLWSHPAELSLERISDWGVRMHAMSTQTSSRFQRDYRSSLVPSFDVSWDGSAFLLTAPRTEQSAWSPAATIDMTGETAVLRFGDHGRVPISSNVLERLRRKSPARLELSLVGDESHVEAWWSIDKVRVEYVGRLDKL
ncbi:MAG: hypothetical protein GAK43_00191 [Stenotrophomonas maltophilia]|nr:MAG: hypothetical protein GAK43_00191 [Stenotrophomonas maltophilia]